MFRYSALAALCVAAGSASAGELHSLNGGSVDVGAFRGNVYYTETDVGYRVVTTIAEGEAGSPVRFEVTLNEGQDLMISVPRGLDEPSDALEIVHAGSGLLITRVEPEPELVSAGQ